MLSAAAIYVSYYRFLLDNFTEQNKNPVETGFHYILQFRFY